VNEGVALSTITWLLEWHILLKYFKSPEVPQQGLYGLLRFQKFEGLGMTHTCCYKCPTSHFFFDESFVSPCDDELNNMVESIEASDETENDI
jgi:hypothetical protein